MHQYSNIIESLLRHNIVCGLIYKTSHNFVSCFSFSTLLLCFPTYIFSFFIVIAIFCLKYPESKVSFLVKNGRVSTAIKNLPIEAFSKHC